MKMISIYMENDFYVYAYLDPRKYGKYNYNLPASFLYEPFYIGKGRKNRYRVHLYSKKFNLYKVNKIKKIKTLGLQPIIVKICENLSEDDAFLVENQYIKGIGRFDIKTGTLTNKTDGGKCGSNYSLKSRQAISNKLRGIKRSEEFKNKISQTMTGMKRSLDYIHMLSNSRKGAQNPGARVYMFISPVNEEFICRGAFKDFVLEHNLEYSMMRQTLTSNKPVKNGRCKGWMAKYID